MEIDITKAAESGWDITRYRARLVREALIEAAKDDPDYRVAGHCEALIDLASDETLAKLGRLLK